ncbi:MAG: pyridoxal-phosphate dependent enzyme [Woeseiaceae bacterium]|nr:pyridoxal-phosphate dependent enzyme [Woeseiaceae bacterium]
MSHSDALQDRYPVLAAKLGKLPLGELPTPLREADFNNAAGRRHILIKQDNLSGALYGGNKVRKLEYLLHTAQQKGCRCVATFGTVGSHHALATALYAREQNLDCICFLSHQKRTISVPGVLNALLQSGAKLVRFGGNYSERIATLREHLHGRRVRVIPTGGTSWAGTVGFVNAGLELAAQLEERDAAPPERLYVATGTMGTAAGLALGLALAGLPVEVHAVRVSDTSVTSEEGLRRLCRKTAMMMRRLDPAVPRGLERRVRLVLRHGFFAGGYAHSDDATRNAIDTGAEQFGVTLEPTYTGKAMAALLHDATDASGGFESAVFWHSYHARPLDVRRDAPLDESRLPPEFLTYFS